MLHIVGEKWRGVRRKEEAVQNALYKQHSPLASPEPEFNPCFEILCVLSPHKIMCFNHQQWTAFTGHRDWYVGFPGKIPFSCHFLFLFCINLCTVFCFKKKTAVCCLPVHLRACSVFCSAWLLLSKFH